MTTHLTRRHALQGIAASLALQGLSAPSHAADYPTKPLRLIVHIPPGGAPDVAARSLAIELGPLLGQQVVVENHAGANGNIAGDLVAKSAPDGYTLLLGTDSTFVINPHVYAKMPFDPLKDLVPVASLASNDFVLSVNPKLPVKTLAEFVELARKSNPPLFYGSSGNGSQHHLTMEMLKQAAGIELKHVPYKGGSPATAATMAGEVACMFAGSSTAPQIKAGNLRAIATTGLKRSAAFPDVPTIAETYPGFRNSIWLGVFAPKGTPPDVLQRLRAEILKAQQKQSLKDRFNQAGGMEPYSITPDQFAEQIKTDYAKFGKLVKQIGLTLD
jgi:tripartite-type tricarboxylate transporter receptor subunit TctC